MNTTNIAQDLLDQVAAGQRKIEGAKRRERNAEFKQMKRDRDLQRMMRGDVQPRHGKCKASQPRTDGWTEHGQVHSWTPEEIKAVYG